MPWNEFLFPVLAGYIFINVLHLTKFRAQRHDGYRLVIESLIAGLLIFIIARLFGEWMHQSNRIVAIEEWFRKDIVSYPFAGTPY